MANGATQPDGWLETSGQLGQFSARVTFREVYGLRVFNYFGEALRQAGILIAGSGLIIMGLVFLVGLSCGLEAAFIARSFGAPSLAGAVSAWCDLREAIPYAFGYMMAAKVGTGIAAEIGSMRISEEIDAMEVMGVNSIAFLCGTRLLAAWIVLPLLYVAAVGGGFLASYLVVIEQVGDASVGSYLQVFWQFQSPFDFVFSLIKGMIMATAIVLVGCYFGYHARGGPVGVGSATAKSMVVNIVLVHVISGLFTGLVWGADPRSPIGG